LDYGKRTRISIRSIQRKKAMRDRGPEIKESDDDEKPIPLKADQESLEGPGRDAHQDFGAVERRDRDQVERGQHDVDLRHIIEKRRKDPRREGDKRRFRRTP